MPKKRLKVNGRNRNIKYKKKKDRDKEMDVSLDVWKIRGSKTHKCFKCRPMRSHFIYAASWIKYVKYITKCS